MSGSCPPGLWPKLSQSEDFVELPLALIAPLYICWPLSLLHQDWLMQPLQIVMRMIAN